MYKILFLLFTISYITSCRYKTGSGNIISEKRNISSFTGVNISGGFDVEIRKGEITEVKIEADDNIIKDIETRVEGDELKINYEKNTNLRDVHMKIFITAAEINHIKASASADIVVKNQLTSTRKISIQSSSGSTINAAIDAPEVMANCSSGADIVLSGRTKTFTADVSSGASIKASGLMSESTIAEASSGASANVHASVNLKASASSGGNIHYKGGGAVSKNESSGGSVSAN